MLITLIIRMYDNYSTGAYQFRSGSGDDYWRMIRVSLHGPADIHQLGLAGQPLYLCLSYCCAFNWIIQVRA